MTKTEKKLIKRSSPRVQPENRGSFGLAWGWGRNGKEIRANAGLSVNQLKKRITLFRTSIEKKEIEE